MCIKSSLLTVALTGLIAHPSSTADPQASSKPIDREEEKHLQRELEQFRGFWRKGELTTLFIEANASKRLVAWKRSAESGSGTAMLFLARCYEIGAGVSKDSEKARIWYVRAIASESVEAMRCLALDLLERTPSSSVLGVMNSGLAASVYAMSVNSEPAEGLRLLRKAAAMNCDAAMADMGDLHKSGRFFTRDLNASVEWYMKAAEAGNSHGMVCLGFAYQHGEGIPSDPKLAAIWFQRAAEAGNDRGMYWWAMALFEGYGTEKDNREAFRWLKRSGDAGNTGACYSLFRGHYNGLGEIPLDRSTALQWLRKAADRGHPDARLQLGGCLLIGKDVTQNTSDALRYWNSGAADRDTRCMNALARLLRADDYKGRDLPASTEWAKRSAELGDAAGMGLYGLALKDGIGVNPRPEEAFRWFHKGAVKNDSEAMNYLGMCYLTSTGVKRNPAEAVKWFRKGADAGNPVAMMNLGMRLMLGEGVLKNEKEAFRLVKTAAEKGDATSMANLGSMYREGIGSDRDTDKAVYWFKQAVQRKVTMAMRKLAECYRDGEGVPQSLEEAKSLIRQAAALGDPEAKDVIRREGWDR